MINNKLLKITVIFLLFAFQLDISKIIVLIYGLPFLFCFVVPEPKKNYTKRGLALMSRSASFASTFEFLRCLQFKDLQTVWFILKNKMFPRAVKPAHIVLARCS